MNEIFEREIDSRQRHNSFENKPCNHRSTSVTSRFCYPRALTPLCFKVLPARVCSVNLRLLTHTTPLFCFFYFKLLFSKTLGLVVIYIDLYLYRRSFRPSQPTNSTVDAITATIFVQRIIKTQWRRQPPMRNRSTVVFLLTRTTQKSFMKRSWPIPPYFRTSIIMIARQTNLFAIFIYFLRTTVLTQQIFLDILMTKMLV